VANANVSTKTNITMNMKLDENAKPISGPLGYFWHLGMREWGL
jgi:hypothetical protein